MADAVPAIADALGEADPANESDYLRSAALYADELTELDEFVAKQVETIPPENRKLVTSHDALGYFADHYGFEVVATAFPTTGAEAEASAERIVDVESAVRESGVPAIFTQETDDPEVMSLVAERTGVQLEPGLLVEAPGSTGSYVEMLRRDAQLIAESLGGGTPAAGNRRG